MSTFDIYEDQENRVPVTIHENVLKDGLTNVSGHNLALQNRNKKTNATVLQPKRTVLSSISVHPPNVRIQPRRAAKQGVSYECGVPHLQAGSSQGLEKKETFPPPSSGDQAKLFIQDSQSLSVPTPSVPSFFIHQDDSSTNVFSYSSNSSSSLISLPISTSLNSLPISSSSNSSSGALAENVSLEASDSLDAQSEVVVPLSTKPDGSARSPLKDRTNEVVNASSEDRSAALASDTPSVSKSVVSPEAMDVSLVDGLHMQIDPPPSSWVTKPSSSPTQDVLLQKGRDFWDVPEYANDIYQYLREAEVCHRPSVNYMQKQSDITSSMRWILVDWLVEVGEEYSLHTETLYLAVSYIDRFLSRMSVKRDKLQLVGTTAMFIAAKYEEIYPPDVSHFAYITDNTYRVSQILRMEHLILKVLSFDMAVPTAYLFVSYFTTISKCSEITTYLSMFLSELSMLDSDPFLRYLPSKIAAASVALANFTRGLEAWPQDLASRSGYSLDDLRECYLNIHRSFCRTHEPSQHAIRDKYKSAKLHCVSLLSPREKFPWG